MNIRDRVLRFRRLQKSSAAWALLRAQSAPEILGFLQTLFADDAEVPIPQARNLLNAHISDWQSEYAETGVSANVLLGRWVHEGYIRDQNGRYIMTDACATAIKFAEGLDRRETAATATHLRIVQDAVDELLFQLEADTQEREKIIRARIEELQAEHLRVLGGDFELPSDFEQRESIRTILDAAMRLAGDFRLLDDQYRERGHELFEQMSGADQGRGDVVERALDHEDELRRTPAGQAFEAFYGILADTTQRREFSAKIKRLLKTSAGEHLSLGERRWLQNLTGELMQESKRVLERRKRTSAALSGYVRTANQADRKAIDDLLEEGKRLALDLAKREDISLNTRMEAQFDVGAAGLFSADALRLASPGQATFDTEVIVNDVNDDISEEQAAKLDRFQVIALAQRMARYINSTSGKQATIGDFAKAVPIDGGIQELLGAFRIAKAVGGYTLTSFEKVEFTSTEGERCVARVPEVIVPLRNFPDDLRELEI